MLMALYRSTHLEVDSLSLYFDVVGLNVSC
jgi:hypothetical protein